MPQQLVVPLFQRPYVWDEEGQWAPLWQDVRRLVEHHLDHLGSSATHFLGAVVIQSIGTTHGTLQGWSIIDGQQRLTTLQILFDAVGVACEEHGQDQLSGQLEALTHNQAHFLGPSDVPLKLRHSNRDQAVFDEVMLADPPIPYETLTGHSSLIAQAHRFFTAQVEKWLIAGYSTFSLEQRAQTLTTVLTQSLQLVVIDLKADENSQEIFETLNARGTPLTSADLIKNFVFQRLAAEGVDIRHAYNELWPFESAFWEKEVSVGRTLVSRSSLFFNQWLISRIGEELSPKSTFARFKHHLEYEAKASMFDLLTVIRTQANQYETWTKNATDPDRDLDPLEMAFYRMQAAQTEALKPALLWLTEPAGAYPEPVVRRVVRSLESWLMRRLMLRLTSADHGRVVADLIQSSQGLSADKIPQRVEAFLARQNAESTYWPGDAELEKVLAEEPVYQRLKRSRLRMLLEAAEDALRGYAGTATSKTGSRVRRTGLPIEHLLPRSWKKNWPVPDLAAEIDRAAHVHRLGNLTLLTTGLNSSVSNSPWLGDGGKRTELDKHDVLLMNREIYKSSINGWDESLIDERTHRLVELLALTWPVPDGHAGAVVDRDVSEESKASLKELVASGALPAGTTLTARPGSWGAVTCTVTAEGRILLDGQTFSTPSGAGKHVRKSPTNGWWFWSLPDGRRLKDLRSTPA
ncbi:DUF262 domain-containing protein [Kineosporia rhizophila]|uniref:GmrSD restriction endonuclease domain-containing protein n=1 Tax=Kineosporia rhizophila TaxID=84633 RepID=UPI001E510569|nr:DUF262 domain-containing protein [Kineosporia rhizophila]MCE0539882.1 DUF262 domain-containing protein [Kineosporia rhizophila]